MKGYEIDGRFKKRNFQGPEAQYYFRIKYKHAAYKDFQGNMIAMRDLIAEYMFYGRINTSNIPMIIKKEKDVIADDNRNKILKPLKQDGNLEAVKFVASAFDAMAKEFQLAILDKRLNENSPLLSSLTAKAAFLDPRELYKNLRKIQFDSVESYVIGQRHDNKILNFETFVNYVFEYFDLILKTRPITLSGLIKSRACNPRISGLVIDLSLMSAANDSAKYEYFINDANFCFFVSAAINHGFMIDRDIPWRIVADLESPAIKKYMNENFIESADTLNLLNEIYVPAHYEGYEQFKSFMFSAYNAYVRKRPEVTITRVCSNGAVRSKVIKRKPVKKENVSSKFDEKYWIEKYIDVRNKESDDLLSPPEVNKLKIDAKSLLQSRPINVILDYIEIKFSDLYKQSGSLSDRINKLKQKETKGAGSAGTAPGTTGGGGSSGGGGGMGGSGY